MLYNYVDTSLDDNLVSGVCTSLLTTQCRIIIGLVPDMLYLPVRLLPLRLRRCIAMINVSRFQYRAPFNEPVTTRTCFHTFCQECILQALSVSNHCPIDRSPLSVELLGQADPIVRHVRDIHRI